MIRVKDQIRTADQVEDFRPLGVRPGNRAIPPGLDEPSEAKWAPAVEVRQSSVSQSGKKTNPLPTTEGGPVMSVLEASASYPDLWIIQFEGRLITKDGSVKLNHGSGDFIDSYRLSLTGTGTPALNPAGRTSLVIIMMIISGKPKPSTLPGLNFSRILQGSEVSAPGARTTTPVIAVLPAISWTHDAKSRRTRCIPFTTSIHFCPCSLSNKVESRISHVDGSILRTECDQGGHGIKTHSWTK